MRLLIWGTGNISTYYMKFDFFTGYEIIGFIDSYKKEESFMGFPVYCPEQISGIEYDSIVVCVAKNNGTILQICIENAIDLSKVYFAREEQGFDGISSKYVKQLMSNEEALRRFPMIFREKEERQAKVDYISNLAILEENIKETAVIERVADSHVIVWIPIELLFSEKTEDCYLEEYGEAWLRQNRVWENIPLISFRPHRSLFHFFREGKQYPKNYCAWYQNLFISRGKSSGLSDEDLIEKRYREYKIMQGQLNKGMQFFIEHPAAAKWNDRGYFNLIDGHHRAIFLYNSGMTKIPVQITAHDYKIWCNETVAHNVHQIIVNQKRTEFYQPILNPFFLDINSHREMCAKSRLHHLLEYFDEKRLYGKKVIDIGSNLGYMGQAFYRMGADVTLLEADPVHYELSMKVNELLYTNCRVIAKKFEECDIKEVYDIAILLTVFYHYFHKEEIRDAFISQLNNCVSQMIIWESGDEPEQEKEFLLQNTKFKKYKHLCYTYATGRFRELGMFIADGAEFL